MRLPVLEKLAVWIRSFPIDWSQVAIVSVQHLLPTTVSLFQEVTGLGVQPDNIFILGKSYSTHPVVLARLREEGLNVRDSSLPQNYGYFSQEFMMDVREFWHVVERSLDKKRLKLILILDEGGKCISCVPDGIRKNFRLIGIEQTTQGIRQIQLNPPLFPVIDVASSATKKFIESSIISRSISKLIHRILPENGARFGVIGLGSIGQAITRELYKNKKHICIYDKKAGKNEKCQKNLTFEKSAFDLVNASDYILGCTGEDVAEDFSATIQDLSGIKNFISCSSEDKEFRSLLRHPDIEWQKATQGSFSTLIHNGRNGQLRMLKSGFPINFENGIEVEPPEEIQLTRCLLLAGLFQAAYLSKVFLNNFKGKRIMLDICLQNFIVQEWRKVVAYGNYDIDGLAADSDFKGWLRAQSEGSAVPLGLN